MRVWIFRCLFFLFLIIFMIIGGNFNPIFWFIFLGALIFGGLFESSKNSNLLLTHTHIEGGVYFRHKTEWSKITDLYTYQGYLYWEEISKKGKVLERKSPYNHWGRECLQNGKQVSKDLAIEWINKLRKADSKNERIQLLTDFRKIRPPKERFIRTLPEEEKEMANRLFEEFKNIKGEYRTERRMEIAQYFKQKGWILPKLEISDEKKMAGCLIIGVSFAFVFWLLFMILKKIF